MDFLSSDLELNEDSKQINMDHYTQWLYFIQVS